MSEIGTPDRLATLRGALANVTVACWMLAGAHGEPDAVRALHGSRLEFFLTQAIDTTVRGLIYDATPGHVPTDALAEGERLVRTLTELNAIPMALLGATGTAEGAADEGAWIDEATAGRAAARAQLIARGHAQPGQRSRDSASGATQRGRATVKSSIDSADEYELWGTRARVIGWSSRHSARCCSRSRCSCLGTASASRRTASRSCSRPEIRRRRSTATRRCRALWARSTRASRGSAGHEFVAVSAHQALKQINVVLLIVAGLGIVIALVGLVGFGGRARRPIAARWRCSARLRRRSCCFGCS